jgi:ankyrin repeat protein
LAILHGNIQAAKLLFDAGARIEGIDKEVHPLHAAAKSNQYEAVKFLLKRGVNINSTDTSRQTALHMASAAGFLDMVKLLINFNYEEHLGTFTEEHAKKLPNINCEDTQGNTPLHEAVRNNRREVALYLVASGANVKARNKQGKTPTGEATTKELAGDIACEAQKLKSFHIQQQKPLLLRSKLLKLIN